MRNLMREGDTGARAGVRGKGGDVPSLEDDRAAIGTESAGENVERGGLASAVGPDDADRLVRRYGQRQAVEDLQ
jgi:hypothetical protein